MIQDPSNDIDLESARENELEKGWNESHVTPTAYLDGLRGLAALLVYLSHHVARWYGPDTAFEHGFGYHGEHMLATFPLIRHVFTGGGAAVALFFIMSGYVLSLSPLRMLRQGRTRETRSYLLVAAVRRPFRLFFPVAALSLILLATMHLPFGLSPELQWPKPEPTILAELWKWVQEMARVMNIFVPHSISTPWFPYNPPVWTMAAELEGSLCLYGLLAASTSVTSSQRLGLFSFTGLGLLSFGHWEVAAFMLGAAAAMLDTDRKSILPMGDYLAEYSLVINHLFLLFGWFLLGQPAGGKDPERSSATPGWYYLTLLTPPRYLHDESEFWRFWTVIGATLFLYAITNIPRLHYLLYRPAFRYLGKISFSLYLIHIPLAWTIGDRIARAFGRFRFDFGTPFDGLLPIPDYGPVGLSTGFLLWQAFLLPFNLYIASIVTRRIDEPSVRFSKWVATVVEGMFGKYLEKIKPYVPS